MTSQSDSDRWRQCPGCGRERRLLSGGEVMCEHNRWDSASWAMVPCEGSSREPGTQAGPGKAADGMAGHQVAAAPAGRIKAGDRVTRTAVRGKPGERTAGTAGLGRGAV